MLSAGYTRRTVRLPKVFTHRFDIYSTIQSYSLNSSIFLSFFLFSSLERGCQSWCASSFTFVSNLNCREIGRVNIWRGIKHHFLFVCSPLPSIVAKVQSTDSGRTHTHVVLISNHSNRIPNPVCRLRGGGSLLLYQCTTHSIYWQCVIFWWEEMSPTTS